MRRGGTEEMEGIQSKPRRRVLGVLAAAAAGTLMPGAGAATGAMVERSISSTGEKLPAIGMGSWQSFDVAGDAAGRAAAQEVLRLFVESGGRLVDSSPMYGTSEAVLGDLAAELGVQAKLFWATKVWTSGRDAGIRQMEESLRLMRVKRMDLMQVHNLLDVGTHLATLREWKREGRIRYVGVTHYHEGAHDELERVLRAERLDFVQLNFSLAEPEAESRLLPLAAERGVAVLANRPFGKGSMFSRVRGKPLPPWAAELGVQSWAQYFLKWIVGHPAITCAIPATRNPKHLLDNMGALSGPLPDAALRRRMAAHYRSL
ncbi:MAG TPA: aldo/keto reductase [Burkholderiales bacterium]|nr:aldo/keto reductase [Burkholderiales bacterium]